MNYMENFNTMSKKNKIYALECEISQEKHWMEITSNPIKARRRRKYIKELEAQLKELNK